MRQCLVAALGPLWAGTVYDHVMRGAPLWMGAIFLGVACLLLAQVKPGAKQVENAYSPAD